MADKPRTLVDQLVEDTDPDSGVKLGKSLVESMVDDTAPDAEPSLIGRAWGAVKGALSTATEQPDLAQATPSTGTTFDEPAFQSWYAGHAKNLGLSPNPDDPQHYYDWRAAYTAGAQPNAEGHWPSQFKREGHPNLIVNGIDTRTGKPAAATAPTPGVGIPGEFGEIQALDPAGQDRVRKVGEGIIAGGQSSATGRVVAAAAKQAGIELPPFTPEDPQGWLTRSGAVLGALGVDLPLMVGSAGVGGAAASGAAGWLAGLGPQAVRFYAALQNAFRFGAAMGLPETAATTAEQVAEGKSIPEAVKTGVVEGAKKGAVGAIAGLLGGFVPTATVPQAALRALTETGFLAGGEAVRSGEELTWGNLLEIGIPMLALSLANRLATGGKLPARDIAKIRAEAAKLSPEAQADVERLLGQRPIEPKQTPDVEPKAPYTDAQVEAAARLVEGGKSMQDPEVMRALGLPERAIDQGVMDDIQSRMKVRDTARRMGMDPDQGQSGTRPPRAEPPVRPEAPETGKTQTSNEALGDLLGKPFKPETQVAEKPAPGKLEVAEAPTKVTKPIFPIVTPPGAPQETPGKPAVEPQAPPGGTKGAPGGSTQPEPGTKGPEAGTTPAPGGTHQEILDRFKTLGDYDASEPTKTALDLVDKAEKSGKSISQVVAEMGKVGQIPTETSRSIAMVLEGLDQPARGQVLNNYADMTEIGRAMPPAQRPTITEMMFAARKALEMDNGQSEFPGASEAKSAEPDRGTPPHAVQAKEGGQEPEKGPAATKAVTDEKPERGRPKGRHTRPGPVPPQAIESAGGGGGTHPAAPDRGPSEHPVRGGQHQPSGPASEGHVPERGGTAAHGEPHAAPERPAGPVTEEEAKAKAKRVKEAVQKRKQPKAEEGGQRYKGHTREEFVGKPRITKVANAKDLKPRAIQSLADKPKEPFLGGRYQAKYGPEGSAVYDGDKVIASYDFGDTLVVAPKYRRQGIGSELVYQWRTRHPAPAKATHRTPAAHRIQQRVWDRIQREQPAEPQAQEGGSSYGEPHEYSSLQVDLPPDPADDLKAFGDKIETRYLADKGLERSPHITVRYGLETADPNIVKAHLRGTEAGPIHGTLGATDVFETPDGDVLHVKVDSPDLTSMNRNIREAGLRGVETQPKYIPHVTLAYLKPGEGRRFKGDRTFEGRQFTADSVMFMPKDGSRPVNIPLGVNAPAVEPPVSAMRVEKGGETRAVAGMDPRLMTVLGKTLYAGDLGKVAIKEAIQNARDSIMARPDPSRGKLRVDVSIRNRVIIVEDNGIGMTPEVATKELVDIGGSYKPGADSAGGFGIAKVAILANSAKIEVTTVAERPDGSRIRTQLTGTGEEWADAKKGLKVTSGPTTLTPGTLVALVLRNDVPFDSYAVTQWAGSFANFTDVPFEVDFRIDGAPYRLSRSLRGLKKLERTRAKGAMITYHVSDDVTPTDYPNVHVLNRGLYQFSQSLAMPSQAPMPRIIVADFEASGDPESDNYPFRPDREGLRDAAETAVRDYVAKNLYKKAAEGVKDYLRGVLVNAPRLRGGERYRLVDQENNVGESEKGYLAAYPGYGLLARTLALGTKQIGVKLSKVSKAYGMGKFWGLSLGHETLGFNVSAEVVWGEKRKYQNPILINPWLQVKTFRYYKSLEIYTDAQGPEYLADGMAATIVHEITHQVHRGHTEGFSSDGLTHNMALARKEYNRLAKRLEALLRSNGNELYNRIVADYDETLEPIWDRDARSIFSKVGVGARQQAEPGRVPVYPLGGGEGGVRTEEPLRPGSAGPAPGLAGGPELRAGDEPGQPAAEGTPLGGPSGQETAVRRVQPAGEGRTVPAADRLGAERGRGPAGATIPAPGGQPQPVSPQVGTGQGEGARPELAPAVPGRGLNAAGESESSAVGGRSPAGFVALPPEAQAQAEEAGQKYRRGVGAHGLGREFLVKVPWRVPPGTRSRVVQSTMPSNAERQEAEVRAILARNPNALTSRKAWQRMQFEAFGDNLLPIEPITAIRYVESPDRLTRLLAGASDKMIADTVAGLEGARALGEAYRDGTASPVTTALMVLWAMLSRQKSPYFHEAAFLDAVQAGVEGHVEAALEDRFDQYYFWSDYMPWTETVFPVESPGRASLVNLNSYGRDFLYRMGPKIAELHNVLKDTGIDSQEFAYRFWRLAPPGVGVDDKLLKFMSLTTGKFDALVLDRVQVNHLFGAGGRRPENLYDQPGLVSLLRGHRGLLVGRALEEGLGRVLGQVFDNLNRRLRETGRPTLGVEPSMGLLHWLTWNLRSGQEAGHATLEGIKQYALGSPQPFEGVFALQGKLNTFRAGASYGYLRGEPTVLYTGPNGQTLSFTPEGFTSAINEARRPRAGVVPRGFTFGEDAGKPFWQREGVNRAAWQRILDEQGVPVPPEPAPPRAEEVPRPVLAPPAVEQPGQSYGSYGVGWIDPTGDDSLQEDTGSSTHLALALKVPGMQYPDNQSHEGHLLDLGWIRWRKTPAYLVLEMRTGDALRRAAAWLRRNGADQPVALDVHNQDPVGDEEYYYGHRFAGPSEAIRWINEVLAGTRRLSNIRPGFEEPGQAYAPMWYSRVEGTLQEKLPERALPAQVQAILKGPGLRPDDVKWSGLPQWLKDKPQNQKLTKEHVLEAFASNRTTVTEKLLETAPGLHDGPQYKSYTLPGGTNYRELLFHLVPPVPGQADQVRRQAVERYAAFKRAMVDKYSYTLPFNTDETMPARVAASMSPEETAEYVRLDRELRDAYDVYRVAVTPVYRAPHFGTLGENLLAHVRFTERVGPAIKLGKQRVTSKKVLFIEEIQSDWIQTLRKAGGPRPSGEEGERLRKELDDLKTAIANNGNDMQAITNEAHGYVTAHGWSNLVSNWPALSDQRRLEIVHESLEGRDWRQGLRDSPALDDPRHARVRALVDRFFELDKTGHALRDKSAELSARMSGPADAPLQKAWEEMIIRRMIRWAAEHGFDEVAWTTGQAQADRYNLSQFVQKIDWVKHENGTYSFTATRVGDHYGTVRQHELTLQELQDQVGNEIAADIVAEKGKTTMPSVQAPKKPTELPAGWTIRWMWHPNEPDRGYGIFESVNPHGQPFLDMTTGRAAEGSPQWLRMREDFTQRTLDAIHSVAVRDWEASWNRGERPIPKDNQPVAKGTLSGLDLDISERARGQKTFYDKKIINLANDVLKPWGVRVGQTGLKIDRAKKEGVKVYRGPDFTREQAKALVPLLGGVIVEGVRDSTDAKAKWKRLLADPDSVVAKKVAATAATMASEAARETFMHRINNWPNFMSLTGNERGGLVADREYVVWVSEPDEKYRNNGSTAVSKPDGRAMRAPLRSLLTRLDAGVSFQAAMTTMNQHYEGRRRGGGGRGRHHVNHYFEGKWSAPTKEAEGTKFWSFPVTAEMKRSVLEQGQPLMEPGQPYAGASPELAPSAGAAPSPEAPSSGRDLGRPAIEDLLRGASISTVLGRLTISGIPQTKTQNGIRLLGLGVMRNLVEQGEVNFEGLPIQNVRDLALIAQVIRNPRYETFWRFFVRDNQVVGVYAVTSKIPGQAPTGTRRNDTGNAIEMRQQMEKLGADGYYLLHNHPSGNPSPSTADLHLTIEIADAVPGFLGHVIIDSGKYAVVDSDGRPTHHDLPMGSKDPLLQPSVEHKMLRELIESPARVAQMGKRLQLPGLAMFYRPGGASGTEFPLRALEVASFQDALKDPLAFAQHLNDRLYDYGAYDVIIYSSSDTPEIRRLVGVVNERVPRAIGFVLGTHEALPSAGRLGAWPNEKVTRVQEEASPYHEAPQPSEQDLINDLTQVGQFVYDDGAPDFETWKNRVLDMVGEGEILPYVAQVWQTVSGQQVPEPSAQGLIPAPKFVTTVGTKLGLRKDPQRIDLVKKLQDGAGIPIRLGRMAQKSSVLGIFKTTPEVIRTRTAYDLQTLAHEVGHWVSKVVWGVPMGLANKARATFYGQHRTELMQLAQVHATPSEEEGFAEFWRHWMTNRAQAQQLAPGLFTAAPALLQQQDPDMMAALDSWSQSYQEWRSLDPFERIKAHIVWDVEKQRDGAGRMLQRLYEEMVYEMAPVDRAVKDLKRMSGITDLEPDKDPSVLVQNLAGMPSVVTYFLFDSNGRGGAIDFKTRRRVGPSLENVLAPVANDLRNFEAYMVARRMTEIIERQDDRAKRQWTALSTALEMTRQEVYDAVQSKQTPAFELAAQNFQIWNDSILQYVRDAGLMTQDGYEKIRELNQNYVPFHRFFFEATDKAEASVPAGTLANVGSPIKTMQGSGRPFQHPLATSVRNLYTYIMRAERHAIARAFVDLAEKSQGGGRWLERLPVMHQMTPVRLQEIRTTLEAAGVPGAVLDQADLSQVAMLFRPDWFKTEENEIWVLGPNGRPVHYRVEPTLYRALMMTDRSQATWLDNMARASAPLRLIAKLITTPKQMLTMGATMALEFVARNPVRDVMQRAGFSSAPSKVPLPFVGPWVDLLDAIIGTARGAVSSARRDQWYDAIRRGGGFIEGLASMNGPELQKHLDDVIKGKDGSGFKTVRGPLSLVRFLSNIMEEGSRVAEARDVLIGRGVTPTTASKADLLAAGQAGRDTTGDWNRIGSMVRILAINRLTAFWNPNIVGLDKFGRILFDAGTGGGSSGSGGGGGSKRPRGGFGSHFPAPFHKFFGRGPGDYRGMHLLHFALSTITTISLLLWWLNHDDPRWKEIPPWQKNIAWIFLSGRVTQDEWDRMDAEQRAGLMRRTIWRVPKPFEMGIIFGSLPERILDAIYVTDHSIAEEVGQLAGALVGSLLLPIPTFLTPILENFANWSFFYGRPVEPAALRDLEPVERTGLGVTKSAEVFARTADRLNVAVKKTLGISEETDPVPDMLRSPYQVDHLIYGFFAGQGHTMTQLIDKVVRAFDPNAPPAPTSTWADIPGIRGFVVRYPTTSAQSIQEFYQIYNRAQQISKTANFLYKQDKDFMEYSEAHPVEAIGYPLMLEAAKDIAQIRAAQREIQKNPDPSFTPDDRRNMLDDLTLQMIERAQTAVADYRNVEKMVREVQQ